MTTDTDITVMSEVARELISLQQQQVTGELVISQNQSGLLPDSFRWHLYIYLGRLVYATGEYHQARRWYRAVRQHCPNLLKESNIIQNSPETSSWEIQILSDWVKQNKISMSQARAIIQSSINEVFFAFIDQVNLTTRWIPGKQPSLNMAFLSIEQVIQKAYQLRQQCRVAGLGSSNQLIDKFSSDAAPVIVDIAKLQGQVSAEVFQTLKMSLNGKNTIWDISQKMQIPLPAVTRALLPLLDQGIIRLETLPDLTIPTVKSSVVKPLNDNSEITVIQPPTPPAPTSKLLIVCIDDSPIIGLQMKEIIEAGGYEMLHILDPLKGIATLLNRKPALIFLDLVMPNSNGYELCTFLRKTTAFRDTPIVILTGHDGVIDRVRAKMAGSSDFLSKPPSAGKVLQMIQKYLESSVLDQG